MMFRLKILVMQSVLSRLNDGSRMKTHDEFVMKMLEYVGKMDGNASDSGKQTDEKEIGQQDAGEKRI